MGAKLGTLDVGNEVTLNTRDKLLLFGLLGLFLAKWFLNGCPLIVQQAFVGWLYILLPNLVSAVIVRNCSAFYESSSRLFALL